MKLDAPSYRLLFAIALSLLIHGLALWGPKLHLPQSTPALTPLVAKLEPLPADRPKPRRRTRPPPQPTVPPPTPTEEPTPAAVPEPAASSVVAAPEISAPIAEPEPAASGVAETGPAASAVAATAEPSIPDAPLPVARPPLPRRAELRFAIHLGEHGMRVGEAVHTLEIEEGHYVLHSVIRTTGLVRLFRAYELTQYSSGSYDTEGLSPEQFFEQRKDKTAISHNTVEFDHAAGVARFSDGNEAALPPDTQDILSVMYQFPPLAIGETVTVSVTNGRRIERYAFEITTDETIHTPLGPLLTVRLHKVRNPNESSIDIWLAREYRLFPVKIRYTEKNGEVAAEAVITDILVSEEDATRRDATD